MDSFFYLFLSGGFLAVAAQNCDQAHYERCLSDLQKFADKDDLVFANSEEELHMECGRAERYLTCLKRYSRKCIELDERDNFTNSIAGIESITLAICTEDGDFTRRYLNILPCLRNVSGDAIFCKEKFDRNNRDIDIVPYDDKIQMACCSVFGYLQCLRRLMDLQKGCGEDAGAVVYEIAMRMKVKGTYIRDTCGEFDRCKGAASRAPSTEIVTLIVTMIFIAFGNYF